MASDPIFPNDPLLTFGAYRLRRFTPADASSITAYANNYNIWKHLRDYFPLPYRLENADAFIAHTSREDPPRTFAIATEHEAIGTIGYHPGEDVHRYTAEIGFWLGEPYHNRGIMTEAIRRFSDYLLEHRNFMRVYCGVFSNNPASMRVLEKARFTREGVLKASVVKERLVLDQHLYAKVRLRSALS
jgi:RimJ/RimL family protein N-acetyltransferase